MADVENITPYGIQGDGRSKGEQVRDMFDSIAPAYDLMNRLMTVGTDRRWRRRCVSMVKSVGAKNVLDLATGTGDLAIALAERLGEARVTGVDLSEGMIAVGRRKVAEKGLGGRVELEVADALSLPFADSTFDAITIAFGVRNFQDIERGYVEMSRVLRRGGKLVVLELTEPTNRAVRPFYRFYTRAVIPGVGRLVSKDRRAYAYLPETIAAVPSREAMTKLMAGAGFADTSWRNLAFGAACIYEGTKA